MAVVLQNVAPVLLMQQVGCCVAKRKKDEEGGGKKVEEVDRSPTGKYVLCPCSGYLHPTPTACPVQRCAKGYTVNCSCRTRIFLGSRWEESLGIPLEEVKAIPGVIIVG